MLTLVLRFVWEPFQGNLQIGVGLLKPLGWGLRHPFPLSNRTHLSLMGPRKVAPFTLHVMIWAGMWPFMWLIISRSHMRNYMSDGDLHRVIFHEKGEIAFLLNRQELLSITDKQ
jgi:hypothetical protein